MKMKIFDFYLKQLYLAKFDHKNFNPFWTWKNIFLEVFWKIEYLKLYLHLPSNFVYMNSRKKSRNIDGFFYKSIGEDDTSRNKESVVYCLLT